MKDYKIKHPFHQKYGFSNETHLAYAVVHLLEKLIKKENVLSSNNNFTNEIQI
jgi:hypothetical protein